MTPEEIGRRLLGPALLARLQRHCAPPLLEDLCQHLAAVARAERESAAAWLDAQANEWEPDAEVDVSGFLAHLSEGFRARGTP